ncbi:MAG: helix-turn-helix domain-containing protein [Bacteroidetes bacterium]|nr:MAG: helix-turn-helix domain-containing protein [Bacteroidota bacterium]
MIRLTYVVKDFEQMVEDWSKILKVKPDHHLLSLPASVGSGYLYANNINEAMSFLVMNVKFHDDVVLERKALNEIHLLLYFLHVNVADFYEIVSDVDKIKFGPNVKRRSIFLSSTNYPLEITYSKGTEVQLIGVYFKSSLVRKFFKKDIFHYLTEYSQVRLKDHDRKAISDEENKLLREIFETDLKDDFGKLVLHNRILLLVEKILNRFLVDEFPDSKTKGSKEEDLDGLKEVEFMLSEKELEKFPSIKGLSRVALMSGTKLKKRFKEVYGMKLYEFYNHNRLHKAKQWIESGETNIKEAAYRIGFANLSNFSKAFKKEFGFLPSQLKN